MKVLILSKRRPQGRDLFAQPYGRFYHLPKLLAETGHAVVLLLLSYCDDPPLKAERDGITWMSESVRPFGLARYYRSALKVARAIRPDWIVGFSDTYFGILARHLARLCGARAAIDAYDNYESYLPWCLPLHRAWRSAVAKADVVTAAGPQLAQLLQRSRPGRPVCIVPMAADHCFHPALDRDACRRQLDLPLRIPLVGYCGAVYRNRGIELLFEAFEEIRRLNGDAQLVVSGRRERGINLPPYVRWMGYLPDEEMPCLLNSMNVLAVVNRLSSFGRFSYPAKLYEAMACGIPVVATATEPAAWILGNDERFLARTGEPHGLACKISALLPAGRMEYAHVNDWTASARTFEIALRQCEDKP
jgi:glycosyltransferase involved in cell wall biosynthesis